MTGRPTIYTEELAKEICNRIAEGESVRSIARDDQMPNASTIHAWVLDDKEGFSKRYVRAKEIGAEVEAEEIEDIAWNKDIDTQRAKLITDVKKWNLAKKLPQRFGDKIDMTTGGEKLNGTVVYLPNENMETTTETGEGSTE